MFLQHLILLVALCFLKFSPPLAVTRLKWFLFFYHTSLSVLICIHTIFPTWLQAPESRDTDWPSLRTDAKCSALDFSRGSINVYWVNLKHSDKRRCVGSILRGAQSWSEFSQRDQLSWFAPDIKVFNAKIGEVLGKPGWSVTLALSNLACE